jgi:hypothetical protein
MFRWMVAAGAGTGYLTSPEPVIEVCTRKGSITDTFGKDGSLPVTGRRRYTGTDRSIVKKKRLEAGLPVFREAFLTVDRSSFRWLERYFAFFSAV